MNVDAAIRQILDTERFGAVATVVDGPDVGMKAVIDQSGALVAGALPTEVSNPVIADSLALMEHEQHIALEYDHVTVFIETLAPPPDLIIFGAVHIGQALATFAAQMGYRVTVIDSRAAFATPERFPTAETVIAGWPENVIDQLTLDRRTWIVVLSHEKRFEDPVLQAALKSEARYIGAMGSRRTHELRIERLRSAGFGEPDLARVRGPVGLDIGAETPQEVAVSILAEMTMIRYGHGTGVSLQGRAGRVHLQRPEDA